MEEEDDLEHLSPEEIERRLKRLTKQEADYLYLYAVKGWNLHAIAEKENYYDSSIQRYLSNAQKKIGYPTEMHWRHRARHFKTYCKAIFKRLYESGYYEEEHEEETVEPLVTGSLTLSEPDDQKMVIPLYFETGGDSPEAETEPEEPEIVFPINPIDGEHRARISPLLLIVGLLLTCLLGIGIGSLFSSPPRGNPTQPVAILPTATLHQPKAETPPPSPAKIVPFGWVETQTAAAKPALPTQETVTVQAKKQVLFEDNFDNGQLNQEEVVSGTPLFVERRLGTEDELTLLIGEDSWTDYKVQFQAFNIGCNVGPKVYIDPRFQDENHLLAAYFESCATRWIEGTMRDWSEVTYTRIDPGEPNRFITISVKGNTFTNDDGKVVQNNDIQHGKLWLRFGAGVTIDNLRITALP